MTVLKKTISFRESKKLKLVRVSQEEELLQEDLQEAAQKILVSPLVQPVETSILIHRSMKCQNQRLCFSK
jgi:hypothetical protein